MRLRRYRTRALVGAGVLLGLGLLTAAPHVLDAAPHVLDTAPHVLDTAPAPAPDEALVAPPPDEVRAAPPPDCAAPVGYPTNAVRPGYAVPDRVLGRVCVPFEPFDPAPPDYRGDYRVREFSFAAAQRQLDECRAVPPCGILADVAGYQPEQFRSTGTVDPIGAIDPHRRDVDLRDIRRPVRFGRRPYRESIAAAESRTYTIELTVPAEPYERLNRGITEPVRLRGWYLRGTGIPAAGAATHPAATHPAVARPDGHPATRALAILVGGRSIETTALHHPGDPLYQRTDAGSFNGLSYPDRGTEKWGARQWREYLHALHRAGFDVLTFDKRGHGISGGISADNTLRQGLDLLRAIDALIDGDGLRVLGPDGRERTGTAAVRAMLGDGTSAATMPVIIGGPSQGAFATQWAMDANLHRWCALDTPGQPCSDPWGHRNIKGAVLLSAIWGLPYGDPSQLIRTAAQAEVNHTIYQPTSEPLAGLRDWPAAFIGRGIWDEYESPFASFNTYQRLGGAKELVLVRGPHSENEAGPANVSYLRERMVRFAVGAALGRPAPGPGPPGPGSSGPGSPSSGHYATLRDAITDSPPTWEPSTVPSAAP